MSSRPLARAGLLAASLAIALTGMATADTAPGDADLLTPGSQAARDLGTVAPGATVEADVAFVLTCRGLSHVDVGQVVTLTPGTLTVPGDGLASATIAAVGPVPAGWPSDGEGCPASFPAVAATQSRVTLTAPTVAGRHTFSVLYDRSIAPAGSDDAASLTGVSAVDLVVTVEVPPVPTPTPTPTPSPVPSPSPAARAVRATFGPPLAGGALTLPRWQRTLPVTFRLDPAGAATKAAPPVLALVPLASCAAGAVAGAGERLVPVRPVAGARAWLGLVDLRGLTGPCARLEVRVGGLVAGSAALSIRP